MIEVIKVIALLGLQLKIKKLFAVNKNLVRSNLWWVIGRNVYHSDVLFFSTTFSVVCTYTTIIIIIRSAVEIICFLFAIISLEDSTTIDSTSSLLKQIVICVFSRLASIFIHQMGIVKNVNVTGANDRIETHKRRTWEQLTVILYLICMLFFNYLTVAHRINK